MGHRPEAPATPFRLPPSRLRESRFRSHETTPCRLPRSATSQRPVQWLTTMRGVGRSGGEIDAGHHVIGEQFFAGIRRAHDPLADQVAQRLGRSTAERAVARAAIEARYRVLIREAEAAVQLD